MHLTLPFHIQPSQPAVTLVVMRAVMETVFTPSQWCHALLL